MTRASVAFLLCFSVIAVTSCRKSSSLDDESTTIPTAPVARGAVHGHVRLTGPVPENDALRMGADPMCSKAHGDQRVLDEAVVVSPEGALANVFVELIGDFPDTPVPAEPVAVDQRGCIYQPRVVGLRVGQPLQVRNSDDGLHNVHGSSSDRDSFNVSQPMSGLTNTFRPHDPGILRLKCDVHTWMVAFVGVVAHPYFAVTGSDGGFTLRDVPVGTYSLRAWHERFGTMVSQVHIDASSETTLDVTYRSR